MKVIAVIYHSAWGHTKVIAEYIALGVENAGLSAVLMNVDNINYSALDKVDGMIFGSPTYMGSVSAQFKAFMDNANNAFSKQLWRNKVAAAFTNSIAWSGDKLGTIMQIYLFAMQMGMIWVGLDLKAGFCTSKGSQTELNRIGSWAGLMTQSNGDEGAESSPPESDRQTAIYFGQRVATIVKQMQITE